MKFFTLLTLAILYCNVIKANDFEIWRSNTKHFILQKESLSQMLISQHCLAPKAQCAAFLALKDQKKYTLKNSLFKGGKNPGAIACSEIFKEAVVILRDQSGNEASFCKFKDDSLLSTQALTKLIY